MTLFIRCLVATVALLFFKPSLCREKNYVTGLMVWNVGQGQFVTFTEASKCRHWDMGGEQFPSHLSHLCRQKENSAYLSHWDWDHIGFIEKAHKGLPNLCLAQKPLGPSKREAWLEKSISPCQQTLSSDLSHWAPSEPNKISKKSARNDLSHIWFLRNRILIPGDSTRREERRWGNEMARLEQTQILILGHHGSHTSTSIELLKRLPHLQTAVASAREARYHHPHKEVVQRLRARGVSVLKTEDWGSILFEMPAR